MKDKKDTKIPAFQSLEEEREYWESQGPLAEGYKARINKSQLGQKLSSFLSVRLGGEELTLLRDMAAKVGLPPSTYARLAIMSMVQRLALSSAKQDNLLAMMDFPPNMFPSPYDLYNRDIFRLQCEQMRKYKPVDEFGKKLAKAAERDLENHYNEIRKKAHDACDKAGEGDPSALHAMLDAILELLWATLIIRQRVSMEYGAVERLAKALGEP